MKRRGQLPKAYLRIDPNIDQHEDMALLVRLLCAANRQEPRGRFKTWARVQVAIGAHAARMAKAGGHIEEGPDGAWIVQHWDLWQEGDLTVGDRMRRLRNRNKTVTGGVTDPSPDRNPPSEASGVKASGTETEGGVGTRATPAGRPPQPTLEAQAEAVTARELIAAIAQVTGEDPSEVYRRVVTDDGRIEYPFCGDRIELLSEGWRRKLLSRLQTEHAQRFPSQAPPPPPGQPRLTTAQQARLDSANAMIAGGLRGNQRPGLEPGNAAAPRLLPRQGSSGGHGHGSGGGDA